MTEEFLQYLWKHSLFSNEKLKTTEDERIVILESGKSNTDSGPDFFNARIKIGTTLWAGNIEVHLKSSDWIKHKHQYDAAYNSVILHVVAENDVSIKLPNGQNLPTLIIKADKGILDNYQKLLRTNDQPACSQFIQSVDPIYIRSMQDALLVERLKTKIGTIAQILIRNKNNWNETFYQHLASNFGFKTNALPFEMLSRSLPLQILAHHSGDVLQLEALLFGQSGLLNEQLLGDDYFLKLRAEYGFLSKKYGLKGMEGHIWKFMRLRPANFPTIRIAQFANLLGRSEALFSKLLVEKNPQKILELFDVSASEYWNEHYRFNQVSRLKRKRMGELSRNNLIINTVAPFLYLYGERNNKPDLKIRTLDLLERIPSEQNKIIRRWLELGIKSSNASDSQALIQLKNVYCDYKKCLNCQIGIKVINR